MQTQMGAPATLTTRTIDANTKTTLRVTLGNVHLRLTTGCHG